MEHNACIAVCAPTLGFAVCEQTATFPPCLPCS